MPLELEHGRLSAVCGAEQVGGHLLVVPDLVRRAVGQDRALVHGDDPVGSSVKTTSMSCSMMTAVIPPERTTAVMMSMIGAFSRVLTPLVGSSRKRSFGPERVGHGHVEQLALALGQAARQRSPALASSPNCWSTATRLVPHRGVGGRPALNSRRVLPSREKMASATLSSTLSWSNRLTSWKLRAMPELDLVVDGGARDVGPLEHDAAGVGRDEPADQVDQGGLPRAVGADEGQHLALGHREVHVVHGVGLAEGLA